MYHCGVEHNFSEQGIKGCFFLPVGVGQDVRLLCNIICGEVIIHVADDLAASAHHSIKRSL